MNSQLMNKIQSVQVHYINEIFSNQQSQSVGYITIENNKYTLEFYGRITTTVLNSDL